MRLGLAAATAAAALALGGRLLPGGDVARAQAPEPDRDSVIVSEVVCAPGTHSHCQPGPFTKTFTVTQQAQIYVDVYLEHTGYYEPNEQSRFTSPLGEIAMCGPIPPGVDEVFCGTVSGPYEGVLPLIIEHGGELESDRAASERTRSGRFAPGLIESDRLGPGLPECHTGSHRQRYEIRTVILIEDPPPELFRFFLPLLTHAP